MKKQMCTDCGRTKLVEHELGDFYKCKVCQKKESAKANLKRLMPRLKDCACCGKITMELQKCSGCEGMLCLDCAKEELIGKDEDGEPYCKECMGAAR